MANGPDPEQINNTATTLAALYEGIYTVTSSPQGRLTGPGSLPVIRIFDVATGVERTPLLAYPASYKNGILTAVGDLNGDGFLDIVTAQRTA